MCAILIYVQKKVSSSYMSGKHGAKGNMERFLIVGSLRTFTMLICIGNFQEVKISTQVAPKMFFDCGICVHGTVGGTWVL